MGCAYHHRCICLQQSKSKQVWPPVADMDFIYIRSKQMAGNHLEAVMESQDIHLVLSNIGTWFLCLCLGSVLTLVCLGSLYRIISVPLQHQLLLNMHLFRVDCLFNHIEHGI